MSTLLSKRETGKKMYQFGVIAMFGLFCLTLLTVAPSAVAFATTPPANTGDNGATNAQSLIGAILTVVYNIVTIVGVIFIIIGLVKFVIAHANEQGPEQQKAAMMMATGLVLVLLPTIMRSLNLETYISPITQANPTPGGTKGGN